VTLRTPWSDTEKALRQRYVTDILVPGYVERHGGIVMFKPTPFAVLVVLDEGVLRLETIDGEAQLAAHIFESVTLDGIPFFHGFEEETGDEVALASHSDQLLGDGRSRFRCTAARAFTDTRSSPETGVLKSLALQLDSRDWLFFDPTWIFGIRLGKEDDLHSWEREYAGDGTSEYSSPEDP
jgi:hypothetical protein